MAVKQYHYVEDFFLDSDGDDVDTVTLSFVVQEDQGVGTPEVVKITLTGNVVYRSETGDDLDIPQSEDFLQQFAAILGYRVDKT